MPSSQRHDLVRLPRNQPVQHLALSRRQPGESFRDDLTFLDLLAFDRRRAPTRRVSAFSIVSSLNGFSIKSMTPPRIASTPAARRRGR